MSLAAPMQLESAPSLKLYCREITDYDLIEREKEIELAALISQGSEAAREKLILSNLRLVVKISHDFKGMSLFEDLVQWGNIGLMKAADKFDPAKGAKFSSYAAWWIKQSIRDQSIRDKIVRLPIQMANKKRIYNKAKDNLKVKLDREPSDKEIMGAMDIGIGNKTFRAIKNCMNNICVSYDAPLSEDSNETRFNMISAEDDLPIDILIDKEYRANINDMLGQLNEREQLIIKLRFGLNGDKPKNLEEVGQLIGRTRERVRQVQNQALKKLKRIMIAKN